MGSDAKLYLGTTVAAPIAEAVEWMIQVESAKAPDSAFGDTWETKLKGTLNWIGAAEGNFDTASTNLFDIAVATEACRAYLYPSRTNPTEHYYGMCWPDLTIDAQRIDAGRVTVGLDGTSFLSTRPDYDALVLADGPIHYWTLDDPAGYPGGGTLVDSVGGRNGAVQAGAGISAGAGPGAVIPIVGSFPGVGTGSIAYLGTDALLGGLSSLTVEAWLRPDVLTGEPHWFSAYSGATRAWSFAIFDDFPSAGIRSLVAYFRTQPATNYAVTWPITVADAWLHMVATLTGSVLKLYVNGVLVDTQAGPSAVESDAGIQKRIGERTVGVEQWDGEIGKLAIYNTALSPARILTHYQVGNS